jgi:hypothetical protein
MSRRPKGGLESQRWGAASPSLGGRSRDEEKQKGANFGTASPQKGR